MRHHITLSCLVASLVFLAGDPSAAGQSFNYPDFSSLAGVTVNGSAAQVGVELQITPNLLNLAGSAWHDTPQPVTNGFDCLFSFRITAPAGTPADGMAFAIHGDPAGTAVLGGTGGALGYASVTTVQRSVVVEFDTYANGDLGETAANTISIHTNGPGITTSHEAFSLGSISPPFLLADGVVHQARVEYLPPTLNVYVDNLTTPLLSVVYDFLSGGSYQSGIPVGGLALPGGMAFAGFTGGTGGLSQDASILSWQWGSNPVGALTLSLGQPLGPATGEILVTNGIPGALYFTSLTFDPANGTSPGQGWWGGLHISVADLVNQYNFGTAPFVGVLDGNGSAVFSVFGLPSGLPDIHGVTRMFNATQSVLLATSNVSSTPLL